MVEKAYSLKKTARLAGLLYFILAITGAYSIMYVPSQVMVQGDAAATANNLLAKEFLFRTGIASNLISSVIFLFLALVLYRLFKQVNEYHAKLLVSLVIVQIPVVFLDQAFHVTSLMIAKGELLKSIDSGQRQDYVMLFLKTYDFGIIILEIFWGLWLIPFGQLVYNSTFIPRILGIMLILGGIAYIIESFTFLLFPGYKSFVSQFTFVFYSIAEISTMLWLLIKGVNNNITTIDKK